MTPWKQFQNKILLANGIFLFVTMNSEGFPMVPSEFFIDY